MNKNDTSVWGLEATMQHFLPAFKSPGDLVPRLHPGHPDGIGLG